MKIKIYQRTYNLSELIYRISDLFRCFLFCLTLKNSFEIFKSYLKQTSPINNNIKFRNGNLVCFSNNPHDLITLIIIFGRREYGTISNGSIMIDIGANIGAFTLYAAFNGAKSIFSFEPCSEAYETIEKKY